ncbi:MAG: UMP kinase [Candidatus Moraniibacteriota bacterium]
MAHSERIIISLGGSLIVPDGIDWRFLKSFKTFIEDEIKKGRRFVIITGGGRTARRYIEAAGEVTPVTDEDKDWLGIHSTRLNAHLIRTIFRELAYQKISTNRDDIEDFSHAENPILVSGGWHPGSSTDYCATLIAEHLGSKRIVNLSNIDYVYDTDPRKHPDAKKFERMTWSEFRALVGDEWDPGMSSPFDPIASKLAEAEGMEVAILSGSDLGNVSRYLSGEPFEGTVIS